jgi:MHS family alpha-ketoglutarate permease-like MFS transporter
MTASTAELPPPSGSAATRRAIWNTIRGSLGNLVEWYDVYVYTVFASYFGPPGVDAAHPTWECIACEILCRCPRLVRPRGL